MLEMALPFHPAVVKVEDATTNVLTLAQEVLAKTPGDHAPIFVVDVEDATETDADSRQFLLRLNVQRPEWAQLIPRPVVIWTPPHVLGLFEREAPDFFDWRSDVVFFPDLEQGEISRFWFDWGPTTSDNLPIEVRLERIRELEPRIEELANTQDPVAMARRAAWLCELATHLARTGANTRSEKLYEEALRIYEALGDQTEVALTLGDIARHMAMRGETDLALSLHRQRVALLDRLGKPRERAFAIGDIANLLRVRGKLDEALVLHREQLHDFSKMGDERSRAGVLLEMGRIHLLRQETDTAKAMFQEALQYARRMNDRRGEAIILREFARIDVGTENQADCFRLYARALKVFEELGDMHSYAGTLADKARAHAKQGQWRVAREVYREALAILRTLQAQTDITHALWELGKVEQELGNTSKALSQMLEAYTIANSIHDLEAISFIGRDLAQLCDATGDLPKAITILERSKSGFEEFGRHDMAERATNLLNEMKGRASSVKDPSGGVSTQNKGNLV